MPGHEKIVSVTIAPARSVPNCRPRIVRIGNQRVAKRVAKQHRDSDSPFARAVRT